MIGRKYERQSNEHTYTDVALLVVRILLGFELLWHGLPKLIDPAAAGEKFVGMGFPGMLAPVIGVLEVGAAALILVGYLTPMAIIVAFAIIAVALVAVQCRRAVPMLPLRGMPLSSRQWWSY